MVLLGSSLIYKHSVYSFKCFRVLRQLLILTAVWQFLLFFPAPVVGRRLRVVGFTWPDEQVLYLSFLLLIKNEHMEGKKSLAWLQCPECNGRVDVLTCSRNGSHLRRFSWLVGHSAWSTKVKQCASWYPSHSSCLLLLDLPGRQSPFWPNNQGQTKNVDQLK